MALILGVDIGVTPEGFVGKTLLDIKTEVEAAWRAEFGANADLDANTPDGQIVGIISDRLAELWELAQAVYSAQDPDKAGGQAQDAVAAITGTVRDPASNGTVALTAVGNDATFLLTGREVSVDVTGDRFATIADATLAPAGLWNTSTAYTAGTFVRTAATRVYYCITSGTSAGVGTGPSGTGTDITDGTAHWRYLGEGLAYIQVEAQAVETGPKIAVAFTANTIETPVSGWNQVTNLTDAVPGEDEESDDELRIKREAELAAAGAGTVPAIRAAVLRVDGVTSCVVFKNDLDVDDADGRPPHSVEAVVEGGDDVDIAEAIFDNVSSGIEPFGTTTESVTDSQGLSWDVSFSRPDLLTIYVRVDVVKDPLVFPVDGSDQIKSAIAGDEVNMPIGKNVVASRVSSRVFDVPGVLDVTLTYIRTSSPPIAATTIAVGPRERADLDTGRVTVNLSDGTP